MTFDARHGANRRGTAKHETSFAPGLLTASLGLIAISASVGIIWWAMATVAGPNVYSPSPSAEGVRQSESVPAAARKSDRSNASEPTESRFSRWEDLFDRNAMISILPEDFADDQFMAQRDRQPDLARAAPPISWSDPDGPGTTSTVPQPAAERRTPRLADQKPERSHAAMPRSHKPAARPTYIEKLVEQGDAGEVRFRYVRRNCTPPNMVDVCFMPAANRRSIIVQRW
jgi:hypothetical protein